MRNILNSPFHQVTNREFSLFLWHFPEYMRKNVSSKEAYLTGFQYADSLAMVPGAEEHYVVAPPEVLFLYHQFNRLLKNIENHRPISKSEFSKFLDYAPEWVTHELTKDVEMAFIGWKNFFHEGEEINNVQPTVAKMREFLKNNPGYERNHWLNMRGGESYLKTIEDPTAEDEQIIPKEEIPSFLRIAFWNYEQGRENRR